MGEGAASSREEKDGSVFVHVHGQVLRSTFLLNSVRLGAKELPVIAGSTTTGADGAGRAELEELERGNKLWKKPWKALPFPLLFFKLLPQEPPIDLSLAFLNSWALAERVLVFSTRASNLSPLVTIASMFCCITC
jgi:hypothetical protein